MVRATTVWLRPVATPVFAEPCVCCGGDPAGRVRRCTARWCFGVRRVAQDVPMCEPCEVVWRRRWRERFWIEFAALSMAVLAASLLVPSFGGHDAMDRALQLLVFLAVMLPAWVGLAHNPLPFALAVSPERVGYAFADARQADRFRQANAGQAIAVGGAPRPVRRRLAIVAALVATVAPALLSRRYPLPGLLAEHTGDALYATAAYWLFALVRPGAGSQPLAVLACAFAAGVEFSQLLTWPWLVDLRASPLGALLLGQGFQVADLFAYAAGALLACVADVTFLVRSPRTPTRLDRLPHRS